MHVIVIGAGPAGCRASELLAARGHRITLLDAQGPWEKPCGGGVTAKALGLEPNIGQRIPSCVVDRVRIQFGQDPSVQVTPSAAPAILSRKELGHHLLAAAQRAGATFVKDRATSIDRIDNNWRVQTRDSEFSGDFIVGADGATSFVRRTLATPFASADLYVTLGYFVPSSPSNEMKIYFVPGLEGYIWSFPRPDHISYGLISRPEPGLAPRLKALLRRYALADLGEDALGEAAFFSAPVPCLRPGSWRTNVFAGQGWALLGDAAGLVDPITGEGIYYAMRSAEILASRFPDVTAFTSVVQSECISELESAAGMYDRFYRGRFFAEAFTMRMVQLARRSPSIRHVLGDLITGSQPYAGLKRRLAGLLPRVAVELALSPFSEH